METLEFKVVEVARQGYIAWDAVETSTGHQFPINLNGYLVAGTFPEITRFIEDSKSITFRVAYESTYGDRLEGTKWTYVRGDVSVVVHDIPRVIFRISGGHSPLSSDFI